MARAIRSSTLETRSARLKEIPVSIKPTFVRVAKGLGLGYRRNKSGGVWVMRVADGKRSNWVRTIGAADDFAEADGNNALTFWQAQDKVRSRARGSRRDSRAGHGETGDRRLRSRSENPRRRGRQCPADPYSHNQHACQQTDHAADTARIARLARQPNRQNGASIGQPYLQRFQSRSEFGSRTG